MDSVTIGSVTTGTGEPSRPADMLAAMDHAEVHYFNRCAASLGNMIIRS